MGNQVFLRSDRTLRVVLHLDVIPQDIATVAIVVSRTNRAVLHLDRTNQFILRLDRTNPFIHRLDRTNRDAMKSATEEVDLVVGRRVVSAARRVATVATTAATTAVSTTISTITTAALDSVITVARKGALLEARRGASEARRGDIT